MLPSSNSFANYFQGRITVDSSSELNISCFEENYKPTFVYDLNDGRCKNSEGMDGKNNVSLEMMRELRSSECVDLVALAPLVPPVNNIVIHNWNMRGAIVGDSGGLSGGLLQNVGMAEGDFRGADFRYGLFYCCITGDIDSYTRGFSDGHCTLDRESNRVNCGDGCGALGIE